MIVAVTSLFLLLGVVVGRWWVLLLPVVLWPVWFAVDWRVGDGLGELWWLGFAVVFTVSIGLAALGVFLRRSGLGHRGRRPLPK